MVMLAEIQLRLGAAAAGLDLLQEALPLLLEHAPAALQAHALLVRAPPGAYAFSQRFPHSVPCLVQVLGKARLALAGEAGTAATVAAGGLVECKHREVRHGILGEEGGGNTSGEDTAGSDPSSRGVWHYY